MITINLRFLQISINKSKYLSNIIPKILGDPGKPVALFFNRLKTDFTLNRPLSIDTEPKHLNCIIHDLDQNYESMVK